MRLRNSLVFSTVVVLSGCGADRPTQPDASPNATPPSQLLAPAVAPARELHLGPTVTQAVAPPPLSGGTLALGMVGPSEVAIVSDPDRDHVYVVDVAARALTYDVALPSGAEPGRAVIDDGGRAHVILRGTGALATIDLTTGQLSAQRLVCAAPRGLAFEAATGLLHVACLGGELVSLNQVGDGAVRNLQLDRDLRDVVVDGHRLLVSRFRSSEVLAIDSTGQVINRYGMPSVLAPAPRGDDSVFQANIAWRMIGLPTGGVAVIHQRATSEDVNLASSNGNTPYGGGGCNPSVTHAAVTEIRESQITTAPPLARASLPIDIAVSAHGDRYAIVTAGNIAGATGTAQVRVLPSLSGRTVSESFANDPCRALPGAETYAAGWTGNATAVAFTRDDSLVVQSREPATLTIADTEIVLSTVSRADTGVTLFHLDSGTGMACASCHPEAGEDGRTWMFDGTGTRRTPALRGGLLGTEPFHWGGDLVDFTAVVNETFVRRMGGAKPSSEQSLALASWVDRVPTPALSAPADPAAVTRGQAVFESDETTCTSCHSGDKLTNNQTIDVGKGAVQVPSLRGLQHRAPYMHDGCASTIADRFDPACGGANHGNTAQLTADQQADLIAYLETL